MQQNIINTTPEQTEKPKPKIRKKYTWDMILMILLSAGIMVVSLSMGDSQSQETSFQTKLDLSMMP